MSKVERVLGPGGLVEGRYPGFETRPQQLQMAAAVAKALDRGEELLVEAGTGVGKTFAYLVPAIQAIASRKDFRVVVSTHTIGLQEQLVTKDIPFLQAAMPDCKRFVDGEVVETSRRRVRA